MPGLLARQNYDSSKGTGPAHLGQAISAFDIGAELYARLGETLPAGGGIAAGARLKYDSAAIRNVFTQGGNAPYLVALRNESLAASLDQAIERREMSFLERFTPVVRLAQRLQNTYLAMLAGLESILSVGRRKRDAIDAVYDPEKKAQPPIPAVSRGTTPTFSRNMATVNSEF